MSEYIVKVELPDPLSYEDGDGDEEILVPIGKMIARLQAALDACPAEYKEQAVFRIWASGDYACAYLSAYYKRPESDGERQARERRDEERRMSSEASDRATYERLKAKYG